MINKTVLLGCSQQMSSCCNFLGQVQLCSAVVYYWLLQFTLLVMFSLDYIKISKVSTGTYSDVMGFSWAGL